VTAKKRSIGINKDWKPMDIPSSRQSRQDARKVYPSEHTGRAPRGESPALEDGIARTMRPFDKEWTNVRNQTARPDGRSPARGQGVFGSGEANEPPAAQLREPTRRRQRRRGDGSLSPLDSGE
jgi:hypothetical protein